MELTQLQRIKGLLPIEITAAFIAIQALVNGDPLPVQGAQFVGSNDHHMLMGIVICLLILLNAALLYRGGQRDVFSIGFSTIGFVIWALNIDETRWQDAISSLGISPETTVVLLPILAIFYSLLAAIIAAGNRPTVKH